MLNKIAVKLFKKMRSKNFEQEKFKNIQNDNVGISKLPGYTNYECAGFTSKKDSGRIRL